ncbi:putative altronate dehydratase [Photobacterium marinum]|uniref:Putative altronate dehydratase n=1 Tax=Photobacterium marinum TaxID=1056511 RepID=L8JDY9_9GAMM|nr:MULTISPECIES: UxaA family hydrolase [Photobacterium]ELR66483.1 putative altronate dehydratase [Photobacterium marinum]
MLKAIRLSASDNVATLLGDLNKGEEVEIISAENQSVAKVVALQNIPFGNKIALGEIAIGADITKAGYPVGKAVKTIPHGQLVHVQNVRSARLDIPENIIQEIINQMNIEE